MFSACRFIAGVVGAVVFFASAAYAQGSGWRVVETSGVVRATQPMASVQSVSTHSTLVAGTVLSTGVDGRVALMRGEQEIIVGPNSRMSLPAVEEPGMTRILQDLGTLLFKVDKRKAKHFRVETPMIAAVVKGTTFTVTAGADVHSVHVAEGAVEVSSLNGAAQALVAAGRTAFVSRQNPSSIKFDVANAQKHADAGKSRLDIESDSGASAAATPVQKASHDGARDDAADRQDWLVPADITADMADVSELTAGAVQLSDAPYGHARDAGGRNADWTGADNAAHGRAIAAIRANATHNDHQLADALDGVDNGPGDNGDRQAFGGDDNNARGDDNNGGANSANANAGVNVNAGGNGNTANANAGVNVNAGGNENSANANAGASANANGGANSANANAGVNVNAGGNGNSANANVGVGLGGGEGVNVNSEIGLGGNGNGKQ